MEDDLRKRFWRTPTTRGKAFEEPYQLFDLQSDPSETQSVLEEHPKEAAQFSLYLENIRQDGSRFYQKGSD